MGLLPSPNPQRKWLVQIGDIATVEASPGASVRKGGFVTCDHLEPTHFSITSQGEIGEMRCYSSMHPLDARSQFSYGQGIRVYDNVNGKFVFDGDIVKMHTVIGPDQDMFEIVAYNHGDHLLDRDSLHGQYRRVYAKETDFCTNGAGSSAKNIAATDMIQIDTPLIFNPEGLYNRTSDLYFIGDGDAKFGLFENPGRSQVTASGLPLAAVPWTLRYALAYVLTVSAASSAINSKSFNENAMGIFKTYGDPVISNVNLEGKTLREALTILLEPHNYGYSIDAEASAGVTSTPKHNINFWYRGGGTAVTVSLAPRGTPASLGQSNLIHADFNEDTTAIVNCVQAYGDQVVQTQTADNNDPANSKTLVKGWQDTDLTWVTNTDGTVNWQDTTFTKNYRDPSLITIGTGGKTAYGVGRLWLVNLGEVPGKTIEDLTTDFGANNSVDSRRFERPEFFTQSSLGGSLKQEDVIVEMSFDSGANWIVVESNFFRVLEDSMGIVFDTIDGFERLGLKAVNADVATGVTYWDALKKGSLRVRVVAAVKSDARVNASRTNGGLSMPLARKRIYNNQGYRKLIYTSGAAASLYYTTYPPLQANVDDTTTLQTLTTQQADLTDRAMFSGSMTMTFSQIGGFKPGYIVGSITGINYTFTPAPTILRVVYDLQSMHVTIVLDNRKVSSVVAAKPVEDRTRSERRLGVNGLERVQGAQKVPYIPGNEESYKQFISGGGS